MNNIIINDFNIYHLNFKKPNYKINFKINYLLIIVNEFHFHQIIFIKFLIYYNYYEFI